EPSGDSCGSAIHVNLKRSFSVMKRLLCARGAATSTSAQATTATETRRTMTELLWITRYYQPDMSIRDLVIVGAGPSGLAAAIAAKKHGLDYQVVEQGVLVNSIYHFPPQMVFFTTPELLEIGGLPLTSPYGKPTRAEALTYYRKVVDVYDLQIAFDEKVLAVTRDAAAEAFDVETRSSRGVRRVRHARHVIFAIGYYDRPVMLGVPGENLPHVHHYYKEPHI